MFFETMEDIFIIFILPYSKDFVFGLDSHLLEWDNYWDWIVNGIDHKQIWVCWW